MWGGVTMLTVITVNELSAHGHLQRKLACEVQTGSAFMWFITNIFDPDGDSDILHPK